MQSAKRFKADPEQNVVDMEVEAPEPIQQPESRTFFEVLTISFSNIEDDLLQIITDSTDFEALEFTDVPTISDAVNLISSDVLRQKFYQTSMSIAIRLKIIDKITALSPLQYEIISTKIDKTRKLLLCFESLDDNKCCFYWKSEDDVPLMTLSLIDVDIQERGSMNSFINSFLFLALRLGNNGLPQDAKLTTPTEVSLFSLADVNDKNLLMLASELGNRNVVEDLIKIGFDVNFQVENQIAADLAWENRHLDVLFTLLLENSLYPYDFNEANTSGEVKEFVRMTHQFVKSVKNNDEATVQSILDKYPNLRYFYSRDNVSAAFVALSKEKFNIYRIFMNKNVCIGPKEDIDKILTKFNEKKREELRKIHLEHSREPPEKFLMILHSNTSVGHDTINVNEKLNHAKLAIEYLCRIPIIRLILQVVAACRDFKLIFDFNRDSVQFLDPTSSKHTRGSFFTSRQVYIAAKFLLDPVRRQEAIGTLAHELCHFAMYLVYRNNCLPYFNGDHKMAKTFHGHLKYCHENRKKEKIIGHVFDIPKENQEIRHAELIVRVPHLLALYHEDQDYLDQLRELFLPLFSFFEYKVVEDMKTALPNIEIEGDGEIRKFNDKRKRKGFFRLRNVIILILIASIAFIGIVVGTYFAISGGNEPVGEVIQPWNAIIKHSRTDEIMCIGSIIHPEFVLTTAECVHKKNHRNPLPPELFIVNFHIEDEVFIRNEVAEINVYIGWKFNEDNFGSDLSLLRLKYEVTFRPISLPPQLNMTDLGPLCIKGVEVLHTIMGLHSFNIPITRISTTDCIIDDYTINRYLGDLQYCARQIENKHCINGNGEQLYDPTQNILYGLVSLGHRNEADCVKNNSLIITELGYYSDSIRNAVCGERINEESIWGSMTEVFEFIVAVVQKSTKQFLCWSFFVAPQILVTDSNCIGSLSKREFQLFRHGTELLEVQSIENSTDGNIVKITLNFDSYFERRPIIMDTEEELDELKPSCIVHSYEIDYVGYTSKYFYYENEFNPRVFSSFCVQFSGGPIFIDPFGNESIPLYGIVIKRPCEDDCNSYDNGFKVSYVKLYDYYKWIFGVSNLISGKLMEDYYCINETDCRTIEIFSVTSFKIDNADEPFNIDHPHSFETEGFQNVEFITKNVRSLPIKVADVFPNLVKYSFSNTEVKEISSINFWNLTALEVVNLANNQIVTIHPDTFNHTTKLRELNLEYNQIYSFNEDVLLPLQNLEIFNIKSNLLQNNLSIFKFCWNLKEVSLSKNQISEIRDNIFVNCGRLERIDFNSNEISFLNSEIFLNKPNLKSVDLRSNNCIDEEFVGSNETKFTTEDLSSMLNVTSVCEDPVTTAVRTNTTTPPLPTETITTTP